MISVFAVPQVGHVITDRKIIVVLSTEDARFDVDGS
jgi:hypothetical protein